MALHCGAMRSTTLASITRRSDGQAAGFTATCRGALPRRGGQRTAASRTAASRNGGSGGERVAHQAANGNSAATQEPAAPFSPYYSGSALLDGGGSSKAKKLARSGRTLLVPEGLPREKRVFLVRHGMSEWNLEGRIQGDTNESDLTDVGIEQAHRLREAMANQIIDACYCSPLTRARHTGEIVWRDREGPLIFVDNLREANLGWIQGMENKYAKEHHNEVYSTWRDDPANFVIDGRAPIQELWGRAGEAWEEILRGPGDTVLVVAHKSVLRALIGVSLGLPPTGFRAIDINNGGVSIVRVATTGEPMLTGMNINAHMVADGVVY
ncbi:unnamed protein product [Pedinophyceae sp. YPF-701]|nr:unnamed protein product [Pedinophyceae sp. YPF-701]